MPVTHAVANVISSVVFGHRFSIDDKNFHRLIESTDTITAFLNSVSFFVRKILVTLITKINTNASGIAGVSTRTVLPDA